MYPITCPHCSTTLGINPFSENKVLSKCPHCGKLVLIVNEDGLYSMRKPNEYKCKICGKDFIYDGRPPIIHCNDCNSLYITSEQGNHILDATIFSKGEKDEFSYKKKEDKLIKNINRWKQTSKSFKIGVYASIIVILFVLVGGYIWSLPSDILTTKAYADNNSFWLEFRERNPYNIQIAAIKSYDDNSYNVLLSEPSEDVSEKDIKKFFKKYNGTIETYKSPIGLDGWLKDAVISFNDIKQSEFEKMTDDLFRMLYGTDYKADLLDFSSIPNFTAYSKSDLNMHVSEEELRSWLIDNEESFSSMDSTTIGNIDSLLTNSQQGIYYSCNPGFVLWILSEGTNNSDTFKVNSRIFSLDSDIILGAIKKNGNVAIIGREREESLWELPPMRSETLQILAATKEDELAQSYERTRLLAGKLNGKDGGKDWAPILLSDALWHTEYGNILNVTDQMLKSWSQNGDIEYEHFQYLKPTAWAFENGVSDDLGVSTLTYNWNTEGVGYIVDDGDYQIYALNRTGSLPVSYIPGESEGISSNDPVYQAEELAYDFFSSLSNTSLVRVVQYASMYQIFRNMGISIDENVDDDSYTPIVTDEMYSSASNLMSNIIDFDIESHRNSILNHVSAQLKLPLDDKGYDAYATYRDNLRSVNGWKDIDAIINCIEYERNTPDSLIGGYGLTYSIIHRIDSLRSAVYPVKEDKIFISSFSRFLIDGNWKDIEYRDERTVIPTLHTIKTPDGSELTLGGSSKTKEEKIQFVIAEFTKHAMDSYLKEYFKYVNPNVKSEYFRDHYCAANSDKNRQWMKCPTVVQSWQKRDSVYASGGHNLNSKVTSFKVNKSLKPGEVKETTIDGRKVYEVSPTDLHNGVTSQTYLRRVGRLGNTSLNGMENAVRSRSSVISSASRLERGASQAHIKINASEQGFELNGKKVSMVELFDDISQRLSARETSLPYKEIEISNFDKAGVEIEALIDGVKYKMPKGEGFNMPNSIYDLAHYTTEIKGDRAIVRIPIKAGRIELGSNILNDKNISVQHGITIKDGSVVFDVPKARLQEFIIIIAEYLNNQKEKWNQFKIQRKLKQRGINPYDIQESTHLKIAKIEFELNPHPYDWLIQKEKTA